MIENQFEENQSRILEMRKSDNALLKLTLDKIYDMIKKLHDGPTSKQTTSHEEPISKSGFESKFIFPLNTLFDVLAFNSEIEKDANYKKYLVNLNLCTFYSPILSFRIKVFM